MNSISSPNEPFLSGGDLVPATRSHVQGRWQISSRKLPISRAGAIDQMTERIGIPIPEMIFGENQVALRHLPSGWTIVFEAEDALDAVDKTGQGRLQVAYASDWARTREMSSVDGIGDVRPYDWSYSTTYKGTEKVVPGEGASFPAVATATAAAAETVAALAQPPPPPSANSINGTAAPAQDTVASASSSTAEPVPASGSTLSPASLLPPPSTTVPLDLRLQPTTTVDSLPLDLLRRRDPILFHDDVILYESELDDNGISILRIKVRVMPQRLLLLSRFYLRLDHVVVRVRDTRVYVDFATDEVLREYTAREDRFDSVRRNLTLSRGLRPDAVMAALHDANVVADLLPTVEHTIERLDLRRAGP